jgi:hypothetical protein
LVKPANGDNKYRDFSVSAPYRSGGRRRIDGHRGGGIAAEAKVEDIESSGAGNCSRGRITSDNQRPDERRAE